MSAVPFAYPASRFEPTALVDLNSKAERERLSRSALRGFFRIAGRWKLRDEDAREKNPERILEVDRITRISYLVGIYKALHVLYGDKLADEWVSLPNSNAIFAGRTPLAYMIAGGLLAMQVVRKLLDARRGGA
jgi:hypothetical protein